jgi:hypothetical protein
MRLNAQSFPNGIPPDVRGYTFDAVSFSQEVVIKSRLPQLLAGSTFVAKSRALLKRIHNFTRSPVSLVPSTNKCKWSGMKQNACSKKNFALAHPVNPSRTLRAAIISWKTAFRFSQQIVTK